MRKKSFDFDLSSRYKVGLGVSQISFSESVNNILQNEVYKYNDPSFKSAVFDFNKDSHFDEILLYRDRKEYLFSNTSLSENHKNIFASPPMLNLKRSKKFIITPIENTDIEVIERYGTSPWSITWRGLLIDMSNHCFPKSKLEELENIFIVNDIWSVGSPILNAINISAVVIESMDIDFIEGYEDTISYTFHMKQAQKIEYQLINN